ncbi:hypothetical protein CAP35_13680 [Chitinophagaceae bacterium IBVUCB1]|nr:hypothetical protein CAP35_13680 [Chitinophagaceae bacterium IBVUCB1]
MAVNVFGFGQPEPLLLDMVQGASAALSLRKLRKDYTGAAVRIRRSSDNAEQDIGFSGKDFNMSAFNSFVGGGTGYIVTFYDQTGNGRHFTQSSASDQMQVIATSALTTKPHISTPGGGYFCSGFTINNRTFTVFMVQRSNQANYTALLASYTNPSLNHSFLSMVDNVWISWGNGDGSSQGYMMAGGVTALNNNLVAAIKGDGTSSRKTYINGVLNNDGGSAANLNFTPQLGYGYSGFRGFWGDIIFYPTGLAQADVIQAQQNQMTYYGIS